MTTADLKIYQREVDARPKLSKLLNIQFEKDRPGLTIFLYQKYKELEYCRIHNIIPGKEVIKTNAI